jgi:hypothetical protein
MGGQGRPQDIGSTLPGSCAARGVFSRRSPVSQARARPQHERPGARSCVATRAHAARISRLRHLAPPGLAEPSRGRVWLAFRRSLPCGRICGRRHRGGARRADSRDLSRWRAQGGLTRTAPRATKAEFSSRPSSAPATMRTQPSRRLRLSHYATPSPRRATSFGTRPLSGWSPSPKLSGACDARPVNSADHRPALVDSGTLGHAELGHRKNASQSGQHALRSAGMSAMRYSSRAALPGPSSHEELHGRSPFLSPVRGRAGGYPDQEVARPISASVLPSADWIGLARRTSAKPRSDRKGAR